MSPQRIAASIHFWITAAVSSMLLGAAAPVWSQVSVLTHHNDNLRTGTNSGEKILSTKNVNVNTFGKIFTRSVDGQIYAQPLYVPKVSIPDHGKHNVVYVATMHDSVYAFDADDPAASEPLWHVNLGTPRPSGFDTRYGPLRDIRGEIGILPTPVIDPKTKTIYVAAYTQDGAPGPYHWKLHALDITTGSEKFSGPIEIGATIPGTGDGNVGGVLTFNPTLQNLRPALTLAAGVVYVASASFADTNPYHGWVIGYDASSLAQVSVFNTSPDGDEAGLWMAGEGMTVGSDGNLYCLTGNGASTIRSGGASYGEAFVKLSPKLLPLDYFMPSNADALNAGDTDLGAAGVLAIPGKKLVISGGKEGILYLLNTNKMGKYNAGGDDVVQEWQAINTSQSGSHHVHGTPIYYSGASGAHLYVWGENDYLRAFSFNGDTFNTTASSKSTMLAPQINSGMPGGFLSISANGGAAGTAIVWASTPYEADAQHDTVTGILRAFDANDLSKELWNSSQNAERDAIGNLAKYNPPTVANGKVYAATFSNALVVYGLLPAAAK
ncbi:MAG: pyrrolo-quinoline quinone [Capsulimonas sp.]|uniref:pyrrolo-quinoline quinone n=1 Tax=Capsulimonas sp. TaxID=2494211 RepID=UPI00326458CB